MVCQPQAKNRGTRDPKGASYVKCCSHSDRQYAVRLYSQREDCTSPGRRRRRRQPLIVRSWLNLWVHGRNWHDDHNRDQNQYDQEFLSQLITILLDYCTSSNITAFRRCLNKYGYSDLNIIHLLIQTHLKKYVEFPAVKLQPSSADKCLSLISEVACSELLHRVIRLCIFFLMCLDQKLNSIHISTNTD